jgi:hypothetical protein
MKQWLAFLATTCVLVFMGSFAWNHRHHVAAAVAVGTPFAQPAPAEPAYPEMQEAAKAVTVAGPLANYVSRQQAPTVETLQSIQPLPYKGSASDHVGGSPVGTSSAILHQTFRVAGIVNIPFELPAHAANAQLKGTYRSSVKQGGTSSSDANADVEFLVLNEKQYGDFLNGRAGEAVFSADDSHFQQVDAGLPPTFSQAATYHLVFRNNSRERGKKVVEADFRIDF